MTKRITPLLDDPTASSGVRELLQAGRDAHVSDYDYNAGLERHLGQVQAGAPMPDWAKGLEGGSGTGAASAVAGGSLIGWLALPVATVAVVGAVWLLRGAEPEAVPPATTGAGLGEQAPIARPAAAPVSSPDEAALRADQGEAAADDVAARHADGSHRAAVRARTPVAVKAGAGKRYAAAGTAVAGTRPGSSAALSSSGGTDSDTADLFARSPVPTATRGDNVARPGTAVTANAAQAERAAAAEAERAQAAGQQASEQQAAAKPEPAPIDDTRLEREMGMLAVAQRVLHADPARTLSLSRQGESEFAGSMFTQERKQLELLALVKLGRLDEAKRLARPYLARYPNGPFSDRVRRALATGRVER